jgi:hypothetical protein
MHMRALYMLVVTQSEHASLDVIRLAGAKMPACSVNTHQQTTNSASIGNEVGS